MNTPLTFTALVTTERIGPIIVATATLITSIAALITALRSRRAVDQHVRDEHDPPGSALTTPTLRPVGSSDDVPPSTAGQFLRPRITAPQK